MSGLLRYIYKNKMYLKYVIKNGAVQENLHIRNLHEKENQNPHRNYV